MNGHYQQRGITHGRQLYISGKVGVTLCKKGMIDLAKRLRFSLVNLRGIGTSRKYSDFFGEPVHRNTWARNQPTRTRMLELPKRTLAEIGIDEI